MLPHLVYFLLQQYQIELVLEINVVFLRGRLAGGGTEPVWGAGKVGTTGEAFGEGGSIYDNGGEILCGCGASGV